MDITPRGGVHRDLEDAINAWLQEHQCANVRFLQLVADGEYPYAVLVAWDADDE